MLADSPDDPDNQATGHPERARHGAVVLVRLRAVAAFPAGEEDTARVAGTVAVADKRSAALLLAEGVAAASALLARQKQRSRSS